MDTSHPPAARVRWLIAGAVQPAPSGRRFPLTTEAFTEQLGRFASGLPLTVEDRIGAGDASTVEVSFDGLRAFQLSEVVHSIPSLRALRAAHQALSGARALGPDEAAQLQSVMGSGRLYSAMAGSVRNQRSAEHARRAALDVLDEALFATARDILQHPLVSRLESAWRGLHWLWEHCPTSAGMDIEVLDAAPHQLVDALTQSLDVPPLQRPDACFVFDTIEDMDTLRQLAALGEQAWLPIVVAVPPSLLNASPEAWARLRSDESSRWLGAALNPVVMMAEHQGPVRHECFTSPALGVAALLSASFRDTRTFARLVGPGSSIRAPAVWQPEGRAPVATEAGFSLREQERLAAQGVLGVNGWWDSDTVHLLKAPTVYGGRDAVSLPAQLLTGRLVRLAEELAERLPLGARQEEVAALFSRAAEVFLSGGPGRSCQLHGQLVSTGPGSRGVHVRASLLPELAGTAVQLEFTLPLRGK